MGRDRDGAASMGRCSAIQVGPRSYRTLRGTAVARSAAGFTQPHNPRHCQATSLVCVVDSVEAELWPTAICKGALGRGDAGVGRWCAWIGWTPTTRCGAPACRPPTTPTARRVVRAARALVTRCGIEVGGPQKQKTRSKAFGPQNGPQTSPSERQGGLRPSDPGGF